MIMRKPAHHELTIATNDGCMLGMNAKGYAGCGHVPVRIPTGVISNKLEIHDYLEGKCNWGHKHAQCCGTGLTHAHGYTASQRRLWHNMLSEILNDNTKIKGFTQARMRRNQVVIAIDVFPISVALFDQVFGSSPSSNFAVPSVIIPDSSSDTESTNTTVDTTMMPSTWNMWKTCRTRTSSRRARIGRQPAPHNTHTTHSQVQRL